MRKEISDAITNISNEFNSLLEKRDEIIYILKEIEEEADDGEMSDKDFREWTRKKTRLLRKSI